MIKKPPSKFSDDDFDSELRDLIQGISKIKDAKETLKNKFTKTESRTNEIKKEVAPSFISPNYKKQHFRPEAALWLALTSSLSVSPSQEVGIRSLANLLGAHLIKRRARGLGSSFKELEGITVSPRVRNFIISLGERGASVEEVFGVWIKFSTNLEKEKLITLGSCIWPAITFIEKGSKNFLLIPRFPERMPVKVFVHSKVGKYAKICEDGYLAFIFWLDTGLNFEENISGLAYTEEGIVPIFRDL